MRLNASNPSSEGRFADSVAAFERNLIARALELCDWNVSATGRYLGIPLSTLKHKMQRFGIRELAATARVVGSARSASRAPS